MVHIPSAIWKLLPDSLSFRNGIKKDCRPESRHIHDHNQGEILLVSQFKAGPGAQTRTSKMDHALINGLSKNICGKGYGKEMLLYDFQT